MFSDTDRASNSPDAVRLLQSRVSLLGKILSLMNLSATSLALLFGQVSSWGSGISSKLAILGLVATTTSSSLWLLSASQGQVNVRLIRALEAISLCLSFGPFAMMARVGSAAIFQTTLTQAPEIGATSHVASLLAVFLYRWSVIGIAFFLSLLLVLRAAIVPSRMSWSAVVTMVAALPLLVILGLGQPALESDAHLAALIPWPTRLAETVFLAVDWCLVVAACVFVTRVIYALRREARKAQQLGQYTLDVKLGEGGMGAVYRAHHVLLRRPTAIKILPPEKAGTEALARFEREVQLTTRLTHPNTITIYDYGRTPDGLLYYAMELLDGADLEAVIAVGGAMPAGRVIRILAMAAGALGEAHQVGLIHRDIKPANIFLSKLGGDYDVVKVLDFGLVKETFRTDVSTVTQEGTITGTPLYMSPESLSSPERVDARTDIYALGAVGYFLLTGQHVFTGKTFIEICSHHLQSRPVPPTERIGVTIPDDLEKLILRCLEKDPANRPQTALHLKTLLMACSQASAWNEEHARAWWEAKGPELGKKTVAEAFASTMAVDLQRH